MAWKRHTNTKAIQIITNDILPIAISKMSTTIPRPVYILKELMLIDESKAFLPFFFLQSIPKISRMKQRHSNSKPSAIFLTIELQENSTEVAIPQPPCVLKMVS